MNPGVPQCKNCWKWGYAIFSCKIQGSKCIKCNGPHKSENHCEFRWCCKANEKSNPSRLETKKGEPCPHTSKCSNCWGNHQADSNLCPFWRHRFNREWQQKKYSEIHDNRTKSICSSTNSKQQQWLYEISKFFCKMFGKICLSSTPFLRLRIILILSLFKNPLGQKFIRFLAQLIAKGKYLLVWLIIPTGYYSPGFLLKEQTLLESLPILIFIFLPFGSYFVMTLLVTGILFSFHSLTIMFVITL